jgi:hypothetical protein
MDRIDAVTQIASQIPDAEKVKVGWGIVTGGKIYVENAGAKSAQMVRDCGGSYIFDDIGVGKDGVPELTAEEFYSRMSGADIFINRGMPKYGPDIDSIIEQFPTLADIECLHEGKVLQLTDKFLELLSQYRRQIHRDGRIFLSRQIRFHDCGTVRSFSNHAAKRRLKEADMFELVVILTPTEPFLTFREALGELEKKYPGALKAELFSTSELDVSQEAYASSAGLAERADFIFINIFGSLSFFKSFRKLFEAFRGKKRFYINTTLEDETAELLPQCGIMAEDYNTIFRYYKADGAANFANMLKWLANQFGGLSLPVDEPKLPVWSGIYDPDRAVSDEESYLGGLRSSGKPVVGIFMNVGLLQKGNTLHIDALMRSLRGRELCPYAFFRRCSRTSGLAARELRRR